LRNMAMLFPLVRRLAPGLDVKALGGELRERISEELDYELEAQHQRRVARVFPGHPHRATTCSPPTGGCACSTSA
ncbi:MAG: AarF/UbiB family protein, partial [Actinomycetota bacterium]|nr:AarF/UbiB family protein [Actinomycetota bacterium]